jgi:uncharacterized cupredoxin-like copper-binding protein
VIEALSSILQREIAMNLNRKIGVSLALLAFSASAWAHGGSEQKQPLKKQTQAAEETTFGKAGDPRKVTRTVHVGMHDTMRFSASDAGTKRVGARGGPSSEIRVNQDDTVKFVVANDGKTMHEMVIGTMKELKAHAELMKKHPGMEHDEPYMAHVAPGKKEEIVWQFTKPGEFFYACLLPGHFEAGMIGKIVVAPAKRPM